MTDTGRRTTELAPCRRCGAVLLWAWADNGRRMPLDPTEPEAGDRRANVATYRDATGRLRARVVSHDYRVAGYERLRVPHRATCPPMVAADAAAESLRAAKLASPDHTDPEAIREALRGSELVDQLADRRARRQHTSPRHPGGARRPPR